MQAIYHTSTEELDIAFLEMLKKQFRNAKIDIVVNKTDKAKELDNILEDRINAYHSDPSSVSSLHDGIQEIRNKITKVS